MRHQQSHESDQAASDTAAAVNKDPKITVATRTRPTCTPSCEAYSSPNASVFNRPATGRAKRWR